MSYFNFLKQKTEKSKEELANQLEQYVISLMPNIKDDCASAALKGLTKSVIKIKLDNDMHQPFSLEEVKNLIKRIINKELDFPVNKIKFECYMSGFKSYDFIFTLYWDS